MSKEIIAVAPITANDAFEFAIELCPEFDKRLIQHEIQDVYTELTEAEDALEDFSIDLSEAPLNLAQIVSNGYAGCIEEHVLSSKFEEQAVTYIALEFWTILAERLGRYVRYNHMPISTQGENHDNV